MGQIIKVDQWTIRPSINRIESVGGSQNIGPRVMQLLLQLLHYSNEVKSREELLATVWKDVIVNEESLTKSISFLRSYFNKGDQEFIETIRSVGYRWVGPKPVFVDESPIKKKAVSLSAFSLVGKNMRIGAIISVLVISTIMLFSSVNQKHSTEPQIISLTNDKSSERVPRISPDGLQVLYASNTPTGGGMDVYIKNLKTEEIRRLTTSYTLETDPIWSPKGDRVLFYKNNSEDVSIQEMDLSTNKQEKLVDVHEIPNLSAITWSPNGKSVIYCDRISDEDRWSLYQIDTESGEIQRLTNPVDVFYGDVSPRYSPDGKKLAFIRIRERGLLYKNLIPGIGDIFVMDLETKKTKKVYSSELEISGIEWLDDNRNLSMIRVSNYFRFEITSLNLTTKETKVIYSTEKLLRNLSLTPKSNKLVFEEWTERYSVWKADFTSEGGLKDYRPFLDITDKSWHPQANHTGKDLAYISTKSGHSQLWIYDLEDKSERQITSIKSGVLRNPRWAPGDDKILYEVYDDADFNLYTINLNDSSVHSIADTPHQERNAVWSNDGNSIYYVKKIDERYEVYQRTVANGEEIILTKSNAFAVKVSESGVYYLSLDDGSIYHIDSNKKHHRIIDDVDPGNWFNWEAMNKQIFYVRKDPDYYSRLYRYNIVDGTKTDVSHNSLNFSNSYQGFSIDPISGVIYATVNDFSQSDIKMLSFL